MSPPIRVEASPDGRTWTLLEPYQTYVCGNYLIRVPKGFQTDFASIPRLFWRVCPPWDKHLPAALVHDYLYYTGEKSRKWADLVFLEMMERCQVSWWKRRTMYRAVRLCAWAAWKNHRKRDK